MKLTSLLASAVLACSVIPMPYAYQPSEDNATHLAEPMVCEDIAYEEDVLVYQDVSDGTSQIRSSQDSGVVGSGDGVLEGEESGLSNFEYLGVLYDNTYRYTYYSRNVLPGLDVPGAYVDDWGIIRDNAGYAVVASVDYAYGTELYTELLGPVKVYDTGAFESGTLDVYTDF